MLIGEKFPQTEDDYCCAAFHAAMFEAIQPIGEFNGDKWILKEYRMFQTESYGYCDTCGPGQIEVGPAMLFCPWCGEKFSVSA